MDKFYKFFFLCISLVFFSTWSTIFAQDDGEIGDIDESQNDFEEKYVFNKKNINEASEEDFVSLNLFTEKQIESFFDHKKNCGPIISKYELQVIDKFTKKDIEVILKYFYVEEQEKPENSSNTFLNEKSNIIRLVYKSEHPSSDENVHYENIIKAKLKITDNLEVGVGAKKRNKDFFMWNHNSKVYCFPIYRGYVMYRSKKFLKNIIIGSFNVGAGQGLLLNSGFSLGSGADTIKIMKVNNNGIVPYSSMGEIKFFGLGTHFGYENWSLITFFSYSFLDHKIIEKDTKNIIASKISRTPAFINSKEISKRNTQRESVAGGILKFLTERGDCEIGITNLISIYKYPHVPRDSGLYSFNGNKMWGQSLFFRGMTSNVNLFGEIGYSKNFSNKEDTEQVTTPRLGSIAGIMVALHKSLDVSSAVRYYSAGFVSLFGDAMKDSSTLGNEQGVYFGINYRPIYATTIQGWCDLSKKIYYGEEDKFFKIKSGGSFTYAPNRNLVSVFSYGFKRKNFELGSLEKNTESHKFKEKVQYWFSRTLSTKGELHVNHLREGSEKFLSYAIFGDGSWKKSIVKLTTRVGWVSSSKNANAIKSYEPALFGGENGLKTYNFRGMSLCEKITIKLSSYVKLEMKYSLRIPIGGENKNKTNKHTIGVQLLTQW